MKPTLICFLSECKVANWRSAWERRWQWCRGEGWPRFQRSGSWQRRSRGWQPENRRSVPSWVRRHDGEEDELFLVAVKSIHVHLELMFAGVGTAMVNRNTDSLCEPSAQLGGVQLLESETTSIANLTGVLPGS